MESLQGHLWLVNLAAIGWPSHSGRKPVRWLL